MPCAVALAIGATQRTETSDAISLDMLHLPGLEGDELLASSRRLRVDLHTPGRGRVWGASEAPATLVAGQSGGQRIRTSTGLRPAVFKTAALPVRSSPPNYVALELTAAGV